MNKYYYRIACLSLIGLASLSACNNAPFPYGDELIPSGVGRVEAHPIAYLTTQTPSSYGKLTYKDNRGVYSDESGGANFWVMLSKPAEEDLELELSFGVLTQGELEAFSERTNEPQHVALPEGVLTFEKQLISIKKGAYKSEAIKPMFADRSLITTDDTHLLALAQISKVTPSARAKVSVEYNKHYISVHRNVIYTMPPTESTLEGLTMVERSEITPSGNGRNSSRTSRHLNDGKTDPYSMYTTPTQNFGTFWIEDNHVQFNLATPINFAAYQMPLIESSVNNQVSVLDLYVSTDGGNTWKYLGKSTFDMEYKAKGFTLEWKSPNPVVRLYKPVEGVNAIKWVIQNTLGGRDHGFASIAELRVFTQN